MKTRSLTLCATDDCNFNCSYCYQGIRKNYLEFPATKTFLTFFLPKLAARYFLSFYGGEPLLAFNLIQRTVSFLERKNREAKKNCTYCLTTNGSLITDEIIQFFSKHRFKVELSFDGLAQDVSRKKGSFEQIVAHAKKLISHPNIHLETNSVFAPTTVEFLAKSVVFLTELGVPNIRLSLSTTISWDKKSRQELENQLIEVRRTALAHRKRTGKIPVVNFREYQQKGIFSCSAGKDRLALSPEGGVWGCYLFADYFKGREKAPEYQKFFFGTLEDFTVNHKDIYPSIYKNYARLSMDNFSTSRMECFLCPELERCAVCPINAALSGARLGKIPDHICEIQKIKQREKEKFTKDLRTQSPQ